MGLTVSETGADLLHAIDRLFGAIDAEYQQRSQPGRAASNVTHCDAGLHVDPRRAARVGAGRVVRERVSCARSERAEPVRSSGANALLSISTAAPAARELAGGAQ